MKLVLLSASLLVALAVLSPPAYSKGCLKGAAVGAVAGHVAGHHAVVGAIGGCVVGRHLANKKDAELKAAKDQQAAPATMSTQAVAPAPK
jgi:hypothetical protein